MAEGADSDDDIVRAVSRADRQQWDDFLQGSYSFEDVQFLSCSKQEADNDGAEEMELMLWNYGLNKKMTDWEEDQAMKRQLSNTTGVRGWCFRLSQTAIFKNSIMALIVVNVACVAFDAEVGIKDVVDPSNKPPQELINVRKVLEHVFTAVFLVEIIVRTTGSPVYVWKDAWLMFDSFIVYAAVLDAWILKPLSLGGNTSSLAVLRVLRLFRAFRAMRILRLFRFAWPLRVLAEALADAFLGIFWIIVIVTFLTFTVSVVATATVGALTVESDDAVASLPAINGTSSLPTLSQLFNHVADSMTAINYVHLRGLYWGPTMTWPLLFSGKPQQVFLGVVLTLYILLALVALASLILGTFVTIVMGAKGRDEEAVAKEGLLEKTGHLQKLAEVYLGMDINGDGRISLEEFREGLEENMKLCHLLGVPMDKVDTIYKLANNRSSQGEPASVDDLMIGILKHTGMSRTIEQLTLDHQQQRVRSSIGQTVYYYTNGIQTLKDFLDKVARDLAALTQRVHMLAESLRVQKTPQEVLMNPGTKLVEDAPKLSALLSRSVERSMLNDLDARYRFKGRLLEVEVGLSEEADKATNDASAAVTIAPAIYKEVLSEEVMPWIQRELASIRSKRASLPPRGLSSRPEASTPHSASSSVAAHRTSKEAASAEPAAPSAPAQQDASAGSQEAGSSGDPRPRIWQALANEVRSIDASSPWYQQ